ncbi:hypothetical protein FHW88_002788 [Mucilaginibacter sp. SG538B]|nr:hypothetical protein [Mucilaginibacter sp. SG538B]
MHTDYEVVDDARFKGWQSQVLNYINTTLTASNHYYTGLKSALNGAYPSTVDKGISLLESLMEDIEKGIFVEIKQSTKPLLILEHIFDTFHKVAVQLRRRYNDRATLDVTDEYDVQDLLHALLKMHFEDIQQEEWTPGYAGSSSRIDFALREFKMVIEVKKTRSSLKHKHVADQLIIDIERYRNHPLCQTLICFVYDPDGYINNPRGFENDLNREREGMKVIVIVRPK